MQKMHLPHLYLERQNNENPIGMSCADDSFDKVLCNILYD